jgi:hypothetical protein
MGSPPGWCDIMKGRGHPWILSATAVIVLEVVQSSRHDGITNHDSPWPLPLQHMLYEWRHIAGHTHTMLHKIQIPCRVPRRMPYHGPPVLSPARPPCPNSSVMSGSRHSLRHAIWARTLCSAVEHALSPVGAHGLILVATSAHRCTLCASD